MAPHSSTLAWKIPWTEEPGGPQSMGLHSIGHDWSDLAATAVISWEASIFPSIFSNESVLCISHKYWSVSFTISPSSEYSGLISFRIDWFHLLAVQGTFNSLIQHYSSKASILWLSAFFIVQLSHPYMTIGKAIALTGQTSVGKVMSLLFNRLSRLVIAFLPRSKCLLISWLQSPSAVILKPKKLSLSLFPLFPHIFAMKR